MKPHPVLTIAEILNQMRQAGPPKPVGRQASDAEIAIADAEMQRAIALGGIRFVCAACDAPIEPKDALICECGGFICPACARTEEPGTCFHERPAGIPEDFDDDE